jgi:hypothetical protein
MHIQDVHKTWAEKTERRKGKFEGAGRDIMGAESQRGKIQRQQQEANKRFILYTSRHSILVETRISK